MAKKEAASAATKPSDEFESLAGDKDPVVFDDEQDDLIPLQKSEEEEDVDPELEFVESDDDEDEEVEEPEDVVEEEEDYVDEQALAAERAQAEEIYRRDVEIVKQRAAALRMQETFVASQKENATQVMAAAKEALKAAKESGDTDAEIEAGERLANARHILNVAQQAESEALAQKNKLQSDAQALLQRRESGAYEPQPRRAPKDDGSKLFPQWRKHNKWFDDSKNRALRIALVGIDASLNAEGKLDKNTPEYFAELGRRFNLLHPGRFKDVNGKPVATGKKSRKAGATIPSGGNTQHKQTPNKIRLTNDDKDAMEKFGMDPDRSEHRRRWLAEKRAQAARAQARG